MSAPVERLRRAWIQQEKEVQRRKRSDDINQYQLEPKDDVSSSIDLPIPKEWTDYLTRYINGQPINMDTYNQIHFLEGDLSKKFYMHIRHEYEAKPSFMELKIMILNGRAGYGPIREKLSTILKPIFDERHCFQTTNRLEDLIVSYTKGYYWIVRMGHQATFAKVCIYRFPTISQLANAVSIDSKDQVHKGLSSIGWWRRTLKGITCMDQIQPPEMTETACICARCNKQILF